MFAGMVALYGPVELLGIVAFADAANSGGLLIANGVLGGFGGRPGEKGEFAGGAGDPAGGALPHCCC